MKQDEITFCAWRRGRCSRLLPQMQLSCGAWLSANCLMIEESLFSVVHLTHFPTMSTSICGGREEMTAVPSACNERQTLIHVLNACPVALHARRYNYRHDALLELIAATISSYLQPTKRMSSDLRVLFPTAYCPYNIKTGYCGVG